MPAGRPSKYDPSYCDFVIEAGKRGKSVVWMCAEIGVDRSTLEHAWPIAHPEFSEAFTRSRLLSQQWWEDAGQNGLDADKFNASVWSRSMAARFPADWREVSRNEHTGKDGAPIQTDNTHARRPQVSREDWLKERGIK